MFPDSKNEVVVETTEEVSLRFIAYLISQGHRFTVTNIDTGLSVLISTRGIEQILELPIKP